jgi:hypothetical protein
MTYDILIKEKQVKTAELEAEAQKAREVKHAEASAQAKVIDARSEVEKSRLMADADANRTRVTAPSGCQTRCRS